MTSFPIFLKTLEKFKESKGKVLITFENIMKNVAFAPFSIISMTFIYRIFQRRQKGPLWSKWLIG